MGWQMLGKQISEEEKRQQLSQKKGGRCHKKWGVRCPGGNCVTIHLKSGLGDWGGQLTGDLDVGLDVGYQSLYFIKFIKSCIRFD